ncbi:class II aldolase/adducin family protein [bacterium]|nr:class II aldolase/adducin family protein [bacterium]
MTSGRSIDEQQQRRIMARVGARLYARRLVVGAEGNLSARLADDRFLTTPSGRCKGDLVEADLVVVDLEGRPARPQSPLPSSEWRLHREIYRLCPGAGAICHGHPPHATACAVAGRALDARLLTETAMLLGPVPLAVPSVPGTDEVADSVRPLLPAARAILLANHGAVAWGRDLEEALHRLESVERLAEVTILAAVIGGGRPLDAEFLRRAGAVDPDQAPDGDSR